MTVEPKKIWPATLIVFVLMVLFPPWLYYDGYTSNQASGGYRFLFSSPPIKTYEQMFGFYTDLPTEFVQVRLNYVRLTVQILILWFLSAGFNATLRGSGKWLSGCLLSHGIFFLLLLILLMISKY